MFHIFVRTHIPTNAQWKYLFQEYAPLVTPLESAAIINNIKVKDDNDDNYIIIRVQEQTSLESSAIIMVL